MRVKNMHTRSSQFINFAPRFGTISKELLTKHPAELLAEDLKNSSAQMAEHGRRERLVCKAKQRPVLRMYRMRSRGSRQDGPVP